MLQTARKGFLDMAAKLEAGNKPNTKGKHISIELEDASGDELEATDECSFD